MLQKSFIMNSFNVMRMCYMTRSWRVLYFVNESLGFIDTTFALHNLFSTTKHSTLLSSFPIFQSLDSFLFPSTNQHFYLT